MNQDDDIMKRDEWRKLVVERVQSREQEQWISRMEAKSKLRTYREVKKVLERESYLEEGTASQRRVMATIRGGSNNLTIEMGRYEKLAVEERVCNFCDADEVEDEKHFLCKCEA